MPCEGGAVQVGCLEDVLMSLAQQPLPRSAPRSTPPASVSLPRPLLPSNRDLLSEIPPARATQPPTPIAGPLGAEPSYAVESFLDGLCRR